MQGVLRRGSPGLKVCGNRDPGTVEALDGLVEYLGFVYAPAAAGPRALSVPEARALIRGVSSSTPVLVAAAPPWTGLWAAVEAGAPVLQPHVALDAEAAAALVEEAERHGLRAAPVLLYSPRSGGWASAPPAALLATLRERGLLGAVEYLLVDAVKGEKGPHTGPRGLRVPLERLREAVEAARGLGVRVAAAGGVRPGNACLAASSGASLLDVSSGVDRGAGSKDLGLVAMLLEELRGCSGA